MCMVLKSRRTPTMMLNEIAVERGAPKKPSLTLLLFIEEGTAKVNEVTLSTAD